MPASISRWFGRPTSGPRIRYFRCRKRRSTPPRLRSFRGANYESRLSRGGFLFAFCAGAESKAHLNGVEKPGGSVDELQRGLRLAESQREPRTPVRQLGQPLPLLGQDRDLLFDRDEIFVARKLLGDLKKFTDCRVDALGVGAGNVRSLQRLNQIAHQILEQRFYGFNFLEIAFAEDATAGYTRRQCENCNANRTRQHPSSPGAGGGPSFWNTSRRRYPSGKPGYQF